jgi:hypothetical protein
MAASGKKHPVGTLVAVEIQMEMTAAWRCCPAKKEKNRSQRSVSVWYLSYLPS